MSPNPRAAAASVMLFVLFLVGLVPLAVNVMASLVSNRDVHLFPWWLVGAGVVVSVVVANRADDKISGSVGQLAEGARGWLPWRRDPPPSGDA